MSASVGLITRWMYYAIVRLVRRLIHAPTGHLTMCLHYVTVSLMSNVNLRTLTLGRHMQQLAFQL